MIIGVGTDILKIDRIAQSMTSDAFMRFTFTEHERDLASLRATKPAYFAKLFAGKEAVFKAMRMPAQTLRHWNCFEIIDGENAEPVVRLHREALELAQRQSVRRIHLSLSYEDDYAVAFAMLEG